MGFLAWALPFGLFFSPSCAATGNDDPDLDLAAALARRGWIELAEELCDRAQRNPSADARAQGSLPLVQAEVAAAKARLTADVRQAARDLDRALARLSHPGRVPTLDERGMAGWLHVQKAGLISAAARTDATLLSEAGEGWKAASDYYRAWLAELENLPPSRPVDEAVLEARLEIPKALSALARVLPADPDRRKRLLDESIRLLSDFQFSVGLCPVLLEAQFEEGRCRADLADFPRAERCFRSLPGMKRDLRKAGFPESRYLSSILEQGFLELARTLVRARKFQEAISACDDFLREHPKLVGSEIGHAAALIKADALLARGDLAGALALARTVRGLDPEGPAGRRASEKIAEWTTARVATPELLWLVAEGRIERGQLHEGLIDLRRCLEACQTSADRAKFAPMAAFKRGECFRSLGRDLEASVAFQEVFRKFPAHELAKRAAFEAVRSFGRATFNSGDRRDEDQLLRLLDDVGAAGLQGPDAGYLSYLRAELLERQGRFRLAADLYAGVEESCEIFLEARVSAGHCYRRDAESVWEQGKGAPELRQKVAGELGLAETLERRALEALEAPGARPARPGQLSPLAALELATIELHPLVGKPREAASAAQRGTRGLTPGHPMRPRLAELEIEARLADHDDRSAAARLDQLLLEAPSSPSTLRSLRRVAERLAPADPVGAARYDRLWLDKADASDPTLAALLGVADRLYRAARTVNGLGDKPGSVLDLDGKPLPDRAIWRDAARAHENLLRRSDLPEADARVAAVRRVWCEEWSAQSPADWGRVRQDAEQMLRKEGLLDKDGAVQLNAFTGRPWLVGPCLEYGHALYQLGQSGQKFQFTNSLTVFAHVLNASASGSEPWWIAKYMALRSLYARGQERDLPTVQAELSLLEGDRPNWDEGAFGMKDRFMSFRDEIRSALRSGR